jgi:hypothetical protein
MTRDFPPQVRAFLDALRAFVGGPHMAARRSYGSSPPGIGRSTGEAPLLRGGGLRDAA